MGFRFQRRIRITPGFRLNLSKSGVGGSVGRTGLRVGVDAKRRTYFSVGLPGTGLSYRAIFGQRVKPDTLKKVAYLVIAAALCLGHTGHSSDAKTLNRGGVTPVGSSPARYRISNGHSQLDGIVLSGSIGEVQTHPAACS
jgi:hypothetical protein